MVTMTVTMKVIVSVIMKVRLIMTVTILIIKYLCGSLRSLSEREFELP
jgi:hypothetical protein